MGLEFLARVRRTTGFVAPILALVLATYRGPAAGLALGLGALWSLVNLMLLERLIVTLTGPDRTVVAARIRACTTLLGMLVWFAAGGFLLTRLPAAMLMLGFGVPFAVLTLKAGSRLLLGSRAWRTLSRDSRRVGIVALALAAGLWAFGPHLARAAESKGPEKFPNFVTVLHRAFPESSAIEFLERNEAVVFSLLVAAILCLVTALAARRPKMVPSGLQNAVEMLVEGLHGFIADIIGTRHATRFVPFLGTLGLYIWCMNLFGLIPFMDSPTSSLNVTFALGLVVFLYAQWIGIRGLGPLGYVDHLLGSPRDVTGWMLAPLMLPIHVLGELAKPISLSCRLFGNIFGEDMLLVAFVSLGVTALSFLHLPIGLPLQLPFLLLALLTSTLQAAVFMVLSTIYFLLMLPHESHEHEGEASHAH